MNSGGSASPPPSRSVSSGSLAKGAATPARDQRLLSSFEGLLQEEVDYVRHLSFVLKVRVCPCVRACPCVGAQPVIVSPPISCVF